MGPTTSGGGRGGWEAVHADLGCVDIPGFKGRKQRRYVKGEASKGAVGNDNNKREVRWEASKGTMGSSNNEGDANKGATTRGNKQRHRGQQQQQGGGKQRHKYLGDRGGTGGNDNDKGDVHQ
jgi:hypothetical protein